MAPGEQFPPEPDPLPLSLPSLPPDPPRAAPAEGEGRVPAVLVAAGVFSDPWVAGGAVGTALYAASGCREGGREPVAAGRPGCPPPPVKAQISTASRPRPRARVSALRRQYASDL